MDTGGIQPRTCLLLLAARSAGQLALGAALGARSDVVGSRSGEDGLGPAAAVLGAAMVLDALAGVRAYGAHRKLLGTRYAEFDAEAREAVRRLTRADGVRAVVCVRDGRTHARPEARRCHSRLSHAPQPTARSSLLLLAAALACASGAFGPSAAFRLTAVGQVVLCAFVPAAAAAQALAWFVDRRGAWIKPD